MTLLPLVSKVAPPAPKAASWAEMSAVLPVAHCRPPPSIVMSARAEAVRRIEVDEASGDGGAAGIGVVAGEDQRAYAGLAQGAGAGNIGGEGDAVGEVRDDRAVVENRRRDQRAAEPPGAEPERAAGENPGVRRLDHAAIGDGERSDQGTAAAAAVADGKPDRCRQARAGAGHQHEGRAVDIVSDEGDVGVDHAPVGDRQPSDPSGGAAADREAEAADIPLRSRSGHAPPSRRRRGNRPRPHPGC